ncbi:WAT1-related protein At3g28050 [Linum perenne]
MIMAECAQVGLMIVSKQVMSQGMSSFIFVLYSNFLASLVILPFSLIFHRFDQNSTTTFLCSNSSSSYSDFSGFSLAFGYAGINLSSPTLATALLNLIPGFTFILAVTFRMEKLDWKASSSIAKAVGTVLSMAGAFIMTCYYGPPLIRSTSDLSKRVLLQQSNWVLGGSFLAVDCVMASCFVIIQALILRKYPAELIIVFFYCFFVAILSTIVCLVMERDIAAWSLKPKIRWLSVLYSGILGSAFQVGASTWCLHRTGPVFVSMFKPIGIVIAASVGVICFGDTLYLGSVIGAGFIVVGFYMVIWGKAKEADLGKSVGAEHDSSSENAPLLPNYQEEK